MIDPGIVEGHPRGLAGTEAARLDIFPERVRLQVATSLKGVGRDLALLGKPQELPCAEEDGASWGAAVVLVAAEPKDKRAQAEHDGG